MADKTPKTNAMRILDKAKISYEVLTYEVDESDLSGIHIADEVGLDYAMVFKTLVAVGDKTGPVVICIPVDKEIDLKKAARCSSNKKLEMVHVKDLLALTGYIRGGCSPIGMKKKFPTYICRSCSDLPQITVSAGVKGCQLLLSTSDLINYTGAVLCDIVC